METLREYASRVGAKIGTRGYCLVDMPVISESKNKQPDNFFHGDGQVLAWLTVKDPSGGVNKSGTWPFKLLSNSSNELSIICC